jgi:hypothetical protein
LLTELSLPKPTLISVRLKRHGEIGEEIAQHQHRLYSGKKACGGGSLVEGGVHCLLKTRDKYKRSWWNSTRKVAGWEIFLVVAKEFCWCATKEDTLLSWSLICSTVLVPSDNG